ncbi:MAG TPA: Crp/Fnr family transcriptional regulator [Woeseiaceae bacterium]|nr:Crp/Fnr family transcriptional regulator [Woeseiaceae bacterium]
MDAAVRDGFVETLNARQRRLHEVLQHYGFYQNSGPSQRLDLLAAAHPVTADDGQLMLEAGYPCRDIVFVGTGRLRVYLTGESGREVTLYHVRRGESCPVNLGAAVMGTGAFASAAACGGLAGVAIAADRFRQIADANPDVREYAFSATVLRLGEIIALVREITTRRVDHRLAAYLLRKFAESADNPPVAEVTQQNIATELGTAREVVSRRLQELDAMGAVELQRGRIILRDRRILRRIIGSQGVRNVYLGRTP